MWKTEKPVAYPADADEVTWTCTQGSELRDPTAAELAPTSAASRRGTRAAASSTSSAGSTAPAIASRSRTARSSPSRDLEHSLDGPRYARIYDAVVAAVRAASPGTKFVGASLAFPRLDPAFFEHFLDPKNHAPGTPLDVISYHFYASPSPDQSRETQGFTAFEEAEHFLTGVRFIEPIRSSAVAGDGHDDQRGRHDRRPPPRPRRADPRVLLDTSRARSTRSSGRGSPKLGIDVVGESQLVGYPTQFPSVTMLDWTTGRPNARYWTLKLLMDGFAPGDSLVRTSVDSGSVHARGFVTKGGGRKVLLVNKRDRDVTVAVPGLARASVAYVDGTTLDGIGTREVQGEVVELRPYAVAVVSVGP